VEAVAHLLLPKILQRGRVASGGERRRRARGAELSASRFRGAGRGRGETYPLRGCGAPAGFGADPDPLGERPERM